MRALAWLAALLAAGCPSVPRPDRAAPAPAVGPPAVRILYLLPRPRASVRDDLSAGRGEAIVLANLADRPADLGGWQVGNEVLARFPPGAALAPGGRIHLAHHVAFFRTTWGRNPDWEWGTDADSPDVPDLAGSAPELRDAGDVVRLLDQDGRLTDVVAYGEVQPPAEWQGPPVVQVNSVPLFPGNQLLARRRDPASGHLLPDRGLAAWSPGAVPNCCRLFYAGQSELEPVVWRHQDVSLTALVAPDHTGPYLLALVRRARRSLRLAAYSFTHLDLARELIAAAGRGVGVELTVEGNPGGRELRPQDRLIHRQLAGAGVAVRYVWDWDGPLSSRINNYHNKYLILDGSEVLIGSGNFTNGTFPTMTPRCGNRDWFVHVRGAPLLVEWLEGLWASDHDSRFPDVRGFAPADMPPAEVTLPPGWGTCQGPRRPADAPGPATFALAGVELEPIVAPDTVFVERLLDGQPTGLVGAIRRARSRLDQSHVHLQAWWGSAEPGPSAYPNLVIEELLAAARRGVHVRLLLDPGGEGPVVEPRTPDPRGTAAAAGMVAERARTEALPLEVRLVDRAAAGLAYGLHNKSLVIDDDTVVISSINGTENSVKYARELALRITGSRELAGFFRGNFESDWAAATPAPAAPSGS